MKLNAVISNLIYLMLAYAYISLTLFSLLSVAAYLKLRITHDQSTHNPTFLAFQKIYIPVYLLAVLGDWLQGPYLYRLYHSYGYIEQQVAIIYMCGLVSGALVSPVKDYFISKYGGRKRGAMILCLLYGCSCLFNLFGNYVILLIGRCLAGIASSLLFTTLEAWYVHEHTKTYDFPKEWIAVTFSHIAFGSSIMAVAAGLFADLIVRWVHFGFSSPFLLAIPVLLTVVALIGVLWKENVQEESENSSSGIRKSCSNGMKEIMLNPLVFLVGTIQSLFESTLFVFFFIWTPAIGGRLQQSRLLFGDTPLGVSFASFMVCSALGGLLCDHIMHKLSWSPSSILPYVSAMAAVLFVLSAVFDWEVNKPHHALVLVCLQLFELACGFYYPVMRRLRESVLPKEYQISIGNWFRIPLTILSGLALLILHNPAAGSPGVSGLFVFCGMLMISALLGSLLFNGVAKLKGFSILSDSTLNV